MFRATTYRAAFAVALIAAPVAAFAASDVSIVSEMFVEKAITQPGGKTSVALVKQKSGPPGTKLVFTHSYRNGSTKPVANFSMVNPIPSGVEYTGSEDASAMVSVDGGKTYGPLAAARVTGSDGASRPARLEDVTHVRWLLKTPIPAGASGKLSFKGTVK